MIVFNKNSIPNHNEYSIPSTIEDKRTIKNLSLDNQSFLKSLGFSLGKINKNYINNEHSHQRSGKTNF